MGQRVSKLTTSLRGWTDMTQDEIGFVVNNIGPDLQLLARQLLLNNTEQTELKQGNESLKEKAHKMVDLWIRRNGRNATKETMVIALRTIDRNDIADELVNSTHRDINQNTLTDFSKLQQRLINRYSHYRIPQPPNIKKVLSINEFFIHQEMKIDNQQSKQKTETVQLKDIFKPANDQPLTRILVEGDPGFGKTTLAFKLANDWARGEDYIASKFHLVLLIPLREIKEQKLEDVIIGIINRAVNSKSISRNDLKSYLSEHKVLLLLDGYDEMTVKGRSNFRNILEKEELDSACILVTSRRGIFSNEDIFEPTMPLLMFENKENVEFELWDKTIQLNGFNLQQIQKILANFEINEEAIQSIEQLFTETADEIFRCPLLVFWLGWLLEKKPIETISTKTAFYKALVNLILHKTFVRENKIKATDPFDIFVEPHNGETMTLRIEIQHFGKIALKRLIDANLSFTEDDMKEISGSMLIVSDLLVRYKSLIQNEEETHYQPMHKSFLEFLAALSIVFSIESEEMNFEELKASMGQMVKNGLVPSLDSLFFPFLAGLLDQRAHWLFDALSPWSAIYNVCQPEMINVLVEITNPDNEIIQSLMKFIPPCYHLYDINDKSKQYYSSAFHKKIFQMAVQNNLVSMLDWNLSALYPLPVGHLKLARLYLRPSDEFLGVISTGTCIHCYELICHIDEDMTPMAWNFYVSMISKISAKQHHLHLYKINTSTCTMVLNELREGCWKHFSFQRVRLTNSYIPLGDIHLELLVQLVRNDRINKGINISLNDDVNKVTASTCAMSGLWEAVLQSSSINDFSFFYVGSHFNPVFDFSLVFDAIPKIKFEMLSFNGNFKVKLKESICCIDNIQELTLRNLTYPDADLTNLLKIVGNVQYLECYDYLFSSWVSSNLSLVSSLTELYMYILPNVSFSFSCSVVDEMVSLRAMTLNIAHLSSIPEPVSNFLVATLRSPTLQLLAFHEIGSGDMLVGFINIIQTTERKLNLFCLELRFIFSKVLRLTPSTLNPLKELLRQKHLNHVAMVDFLSSAPVRSIIPVWFSEEEFQFKLQINGYEQNHSIYNRQLFERHLEINNRIVIELKH